MRDPVLGSADGTNQTGGGAEAGGGDRAITSIDDGLAIGVARPTLRGHLFVESMIKQHDFSAHLVARQ